MNKSTSTQTMMTYPAVYIGSEHEFPNLTYEENGVDVITRGELWHKIPVAMLLALIMIATIVGNSCVIAAVIREKRLQTLANRLVASLAVTDMMVGLLVMPLSAADLIAKRWPFGETLCDLFITLDVLCCTSSILHLVAIALDRLWTITDVTYNRGSKKHKYFVPCMITGAWLLSLAICLPPFFGWRRTYQQGVCMISQDHGYTIYSTVGAFYLPLIVITAIYTRIFMEVRARVRRSTFKKRTDKNNRKYKQDLKSDISTSDLVTQSDTMETIAERDSVHNGQTTTRDITGQNGQTTPTGISINTQCKLQDRENNTKLENNNHLQVEVTTNSSSPNPQTLTPSPSLTTNSTSPRLLRSSMQLLLSVPLINKRKEKTKADKLAARREKKAFRTLLIITGVFVTCWLPFFIIATLVPFCTSCHVPDMLIRFVTWLGYFNCMLNPIIYTIFSPDFRMAFKSLLSCKRHNLCIFTHS